MPNARRRTTDIAAAAPTSRAWAGRIDAIQTALQGWYSQHRRDLPWRRTRDPYAIWVSEVMLQQTRVATVVPYYTRFLERFPTPRALADAPLDQVLALWSGLGYYRRARLMHAGAQTVVRDHGGLFPHDLQAIRALPGIGDYTAGAIASIALGLPEPVLDGNVERVLSRLVALEGDVRAPAQRAALWKIAREMANCDSPGEVNQGLMELGATVCAPTDPQCGACPLVAHCIARQRNQVERFPEKTPKAAVRTERWSALVATRGDAVWLTPSTLGRWQGMLVPWLAPRSAANYQALGVRSLEAVGECVHVLTHARMEVLVHRASAPARISAGELVPRADLDQRAVPAITRAVLAVAGRRSAIAPPAERTARARGTRTPR